MTAKTPGIRRFFSHIGLMVVLNLLVKPIWVLTEMEVQDVVGHQAWGMYSAALSLGFIFLTLADLGINYYATKSLAADATQLQREFPHLVGLKLILLLIYPPIMYGVGLIMGYEPVQLELLFWLCFVQGGAQLMDFFRANFRALQRYGLDALLSVFERIVLLGLVIGLFLTTLTVERFVYARLAAVGISILFFYGLLSYLYGWLRPRFNPKTARQLVRMSLPFAAMTVLYSIHDKVDQVMLERMAGDVPTGLYAAAYRWLDAFSMYLWIVLPMFFARFAHFPGEFDKQGKLLKLGQMITGVPLTFVAAFGWFHGEHLFFMYDQSTSAEELAIMVAALQGLFAALFINGNLAVFSTLLTSTGHERFVNRLIGASIVLNVLLNLLLIPSLGALACAWSTVASFALSGAGYLAYIQQKLQVPIPWKALGRQLLSFAVLLGAFWGLSQTDLSWWLQTVIAGFVYLATLLLFGWWRDLDLKVFKLS